MTNHPIAEQDSLERLIARLRESAKAYRGMLHGGHGNDCDEAADTLRQMRDALTKARYIIWQDARACRAFAADDEPVEAEEVLKLIDATLTTPKIEKE